MHSGQLVNDSGEVTFDFWTTGIMVQEISDASQNLLSASNQENDSEEYVSLAIQTPSEPVSLALCRVGHAPSYSTDAHDLL